LKRFSHYIGAQAKEACNIDQLYAGLEAGIEGGIHAMQALWDLHETEENSCSSMRPTHSMERIGSKCCGRSDTSGRPGPGLYLIAKNTGRYSSSKATTVTPSLSSAKKA
jgi:hypothetical protein